MTNYNDGKWHAWGSDITPASVHSKSMIEYVWHDANRNNAGVKASSAGCDENGVGPAWNHILKFRVVKEYKKPREFWLTIDGKISKKSPWPFVKAIHVREVLE